LEDARVADFNGDGGDTHFHCCAAERAAGTGVVDDYLALAEVT
jgi:hypothetical protein